MKTGPVYNFLFTIIEPKGQPVCGKKKAPLTATSELFRFAIAVIDAFLDRVVEANTGSTLNLGFTFKSASITFNLTGLP